MQRWDLIIMLLALFNCYFVPIQVAFELEYLQSNNFRNLNHVIDFLFFLDMMITARTEYINCKGEECSDPYDIAINYLKTTFILDLAATVPFDALLSSLDSYQKYKINAKEEGKIQWVDLLGMLKIGRILRLNTFIQYMNSTENMKAFLRILKMVLFLIIYVHCYACNWWFLVKQDRIWIPPKDTVLDDYYQIYS